METAKQNIAGQPTLVDTDASDVVQPSNPDTRQGFPDPLNPPPEVVVPGPSNVPTAPEAPVEPQKPEGGTEPPKKDGEAPDAVTERLKQQNAQNTKLLVALGIDPESDIAEQLEHGLISAEDVKRYVANKYQPQTAAPEPVVATPTDDPIAKAEQALKEIEAKYNKEIEENDGVVSLRTNAELRLADRNLNEARLDKLTQQIAADKEQAVLDKRAQQANKNVEAVLSITREIPEFANMDAPLQQAVEQASVALTGMIADQKSREMGLDPASLNPQQYQYSAKEANTILGNLAEYYRNLGREEVKAQFQPPSAQPNQLANNVSAPQPVVVTPADSSGAPIPTVNPYGNTRVGNHEQMARDYVSKHRAVV